jgi:peptidylprolyl isomerase
MLVLTRRAGEQIVIDGAVFVTVTAIHGDRVRLGIVAPASVRVDRWEVHERRGLCNSRGLTDPVSSTSEGEKAMRTAQQGDRVQVHYVKRWEDGSVASSAGRAPLEMTVGVDHRRLPGLGTALVGLGPGDRTTFTVPPERACGPRAAGRVYRLARTRFPNSQVLVVGTLVRLTDRQGRPRLLRILEVGERAVFVETNHPRAGQALNLEVVLVAIHGPEAEAGPDLLGR